MSSVRSLWFVVYRHSDRSVSRPVNQEDETHRGRRDVTPYSRCHDANEGETPAQYQNLSSRQLYSTRCFTPSQLFEKDIYWCYTPVKGLWPKRCALSKVWTQQALMVCRRLSSVTYPAATQVCKKSSGGTFPPGIASTWTDTNLGLKSAECWWARQWQRPLKGVKSLHLLFI